VLATDQLASVTEYAPRDMTISVGAGLKLTDLNDLLAAERQRLPIDPPLAGGPTVGGIIAANDAGPIRLANGTTRDLVIGMRMVLADGSQVRSGGKVVKNVAGYDLHKLFIGSAGTLGVITEVTFKLRPIPEAVRLVVLRPPSFTVAGQWVTDIMRSAVRPTLLDLLNGPEVERHVDREGAAGLALVVGFEETREATDWQCEQLVEKFRDDANAYDDDASRSLYETLRERPAEPARVAFKATMRPTHLPVFAETISQAGWELIARAANGIVYASTDDIALAEQLPELQRLAHEGAGGLTLLNGPGPIADYGWQNAPDHAMLMRRIKDQFDPKRLFGDGPFVNTQARTS
jgi:glycolate oxidase FAD binding subunit